jgi:hypothetical protein
MGNDADLIAAIYDAVIDPSGWDEVVKRIVEATKSVSGCIPVQQKNAACLSATYNLDPFYANAYVQTWHNNNPLFVVPATMAPGELRTATHITQTDTFKASAFFNEYMCPQGKADLVTVCLLRRPSFFKLLVLQRSPGAIWVEPERVASPGNPCATFEASRRGSSATFPGLGGNGLARRGGRGRRFRRFPFDRGLPGRLRQRQSRGSHSAGNRLAL